ncbi:conserved hypothetical protein [Pediculus humanus corporis]|uniref:Uncharacterized protein n=1 Tax=Pediculus humanus subsp. corporis TaxID=121224 RepID=E0W128_PEDHC|nr:uncharacterized protein Phum_PHUM568470 [Pediculus humanus corporis]EEB19334.1 conserved hypothetical protein [Pediculus humanus corporis]
MTSTDNRKDANHVQNNHVRPRSLYTAHSYHGENDESNYSRYNDLTKYFDHSSSDQWNSSSRWRQLRSAGSKPTVVAPFFPNEDGPPSIYADKWREITDATEPSPGAAIATATGIMSLRLHDRLRVDMTIDKAIRVINVKNNIVLALSGSGSAAALMHPNGRVYQYGSRVEIVAHDINHGNNKYAKMWYKGVSFTSEQCALVYLVDTAGTRTTTDTFTDMTQDFSLSVFYAESRYGSQYIDDAIRLLEGAQYWVTDEGIENWIINNLRISQAPDGLLRIARNSNKYQIRTSPSNGTASLTTPFVHCTASLGQTSHLFVRRGERRMHYDGASFIVRNAGHSAGFDDKNQLKVY